MLDITGRIMKIRETLTILRASLQFYSKNKKNWGHLEPARSQLCISHDDKYLRVKFFTRELLKI